MIAANHVIQQYYMIQTIIYSFAIFTTSILSYYALFQPNDFFIDKQPLITPDIEEQQKNKLNVSVCGYKYRELAGNKIVLFEIFVDINYKSHKVSRTFAEFESLHNKIAEKIAADAYPALELPENPKFLSGLNLDEKTSKLGEYLEKLCSQPLLCPELVDFLKIEGRARESLLESTIKGLESGQNESIPRNRSEILEYYNPKLLGNESLLMSIPAFHLNWMVDVQIPSWQRADTHIEYHIRAEIRLLSFESWTVSRFSEMYNLNKLLKRMHIPVPAFPSKNLHTDVKHLNEEAIEFRRAALEDYLCAVFNDPAFLCTAALKFVNCELEIGNILRLIPANLTYELLGPMKWECEIAHDSSQYISFHMKLRKILPSHTKDWDISRRFREFEALHKHLSARSISQPLRDFLHSEPIPLPALPPKSISPLVLSTEIETRRQALELYLSDLLHNPSVTCCHYFRRFIGEIE
jgi:hypothetical protein